LPKETSLTRNIREVFDDYGGWGTLFSSGYFRLALVLSACLWPLFGGGKWAEFAVGIIPVVLGLTLAGAAILTTIGGDAFRARLAQVPGSTGQEAPILELLSNFIVAMIVQLCALIYALIFQAKPFEAVWLKSFGMPASAADRINIVAGGIGSVLLVYAILLILGAAFTVRALATVYVLDARAEEASSSEPQPSGGSPPGDRTVRAGKLQGDPQLPNAAPAASVNLDHHRTIRIGPDEAH
jgi:hypothetical protein